MYRDFVIGTWSKVLVQYPEDHKDFVEFTGSTIDFFLFLLLFSRSAPEVHASVQEIFDPCTLL